MDPAYRNIRDGMHSPLVEGRAFTESLWKQYAPMADSHFRKDARAHFIERFWEMYLGIAFLEREVMVVPGTGAGPEFSFIETGRRYWVEAVAPGPGTGADQVSSTTQGVPYTVPTEKILLRYTSAINDKHDCYHKALRAGIISPDDGYVLAINSRKIPHAPYGNTLPYFIQALLPFGHLTVVLNRSTGALEDRFYQARDSVLKNNNSAVSTKLFLDPKFSFISAVLDSAVDCVNRPERMGDDFSVLYNPMASQPLESATFAWCDQYFYQDGELKKIGRASG